MSRNPLAAATPAIFPCWRQPSALPAVQGCSYSATSIEVTVSTNESVSPSESIPSASASQAAEAEASQPHAGSTAQAPETITLDMIREHLFTAVISDALDAAGYREQSLPDLLTPMTGIDRLVGRCRTTLWEDIDHEDPAPYELELQAVDGCQPHDVLIAAADGSTRSGIWGELLSTAARNRGCVGAIIHGAVRDIRQMTAMQFPVFASSACPYDSLHRQRVTAVDVPVTIGGLTFTPGDLVVADRDGLVVVPAAVERAVIRAAWEKVHAESVTRDAIRGGMSAGEVYEKYGVL